MKGMFPEFDRHSEDQYKSAWENGLIVFDANVLLNLYRYRATTRDEFISTLKALKARVWIPYQAALEFQRNRLVVIADQSSKLNSIKTGIEKALNSLALDIEKNFSGRSNPLVDAADFMAEVNMAKTKFFKDIDRAGGKLPSLSERDKIKASLEEIFEKKVGAAPSTQDELSSIYKEAEERFKVRQPPGYLDSEKAKDGEGMFLHNGIVYQKKYGDYVVWRELLTYVKENRFKELIFVTDDRKDDWWWSIESGGKKTIGPRYELIEEARLIGGVEIFMMYQPDRFLTYAKSHLNVKVSDESVKEVRDLAEFKNDNQIGLNFEGWVNSEPEDAKDITPILEWIQVKSGSNFVIRVSNNSFCVDKNGLLTCYCVTYFPERGVLKKNEDLENFVMSRITSFLSHAIDIAFKKNIHDVKVVIYAPTFHVIETVAFIFRRNIFMLNAGNVEVVFGWVSPGVKGEGRSFNAYESITLPSSN